jgi:hypothetical protein
VSDRIGGWNVRASASNGIATAAKGGDANKQHVVYSVSASFSAAPSAPVLCQIVDPDVSPNTVLWEDYVSAPVVAAFPAGITVPVGHNVEAILGAGGSTIVGKVNLHGASR